MSDRQFYTATVDGDPVSSLRDNVEASLGVARHLTWASIDDGDSPYAVPTTVDVIDCDAAAGAIECDLPASPDTGETYVFRKSDATNNVTIDGNGKNIDGAATKVLSSQYDTARLSYNGTEWAVL